jgi:D-glycero-alpha-D-manno-heptose-7-phosphate kinase
MIICKSPFRISFAGGGTDLKEWLKVKGKGRVLTANFDRYTYCLVNERNHFFDEKYRILSSNNQLVNTIDEIDHPFIRETLKYFQVFDGVEINYNGDLPGKSGIGSSASLGIVLIKSIGKLKRINFSNNQIYEIYNEIENKILNGNMGYQDQAGVLYPGLKVINFSDSGQVTIDKIGNQKIYNEISQSLYLVYSGQQRISTKFSANMNVNIKEFNIDTFKALERNFELVDEMIEGINSRNYDVIADIFNKSWENKLLANPKSITPKIFKLREDLIQLGAKGVKIMGAGGGGFLAVWINGSFEKIISKIKDYGINILPIKIVDENVSFLESNGYD